MTKWTLGLAGLLAGCFFEVRGGPLVPTRHGYGNWGGQLVGTSGGDKELSWGRVGGGGTLAGYSSSSDAGLTWIAGGIHGRSEVTLKRLWYRLEPSETRTFKKQIVWLSTLSLGAGGSTSPSSERVMYIDAFSGIGLSNRDPGRLRWLTYAVGAVGNRLWPESSDGAWFAGVAISVSAGYDLTDPGPP